MALDKTKEQLIEDERIDLFEEGFPVLKTLPTNTNYVSPLGILGIEWDDYVVPFLQKNYPDNLYPTERSKIIAFMEMVFATAGVPSVDMIGTEIIKSLGLDQIGLKPKAAEWLLGFMVRRMIQIVEDDSQRVSPVQEELLDAAGVVATNVDRDIDETALNDDQLLRQSVAIVEQIRSSAVPTWFGMTAAQLGNINLVRQNSRGVDVLLTNYQGKIETLEAAIEAYSARRDELNPKEQVIFRQIIDAKNRLEHEFQEVLLNNLVRIFTAKTFGLRRSVFDDPDEFDFAMEAVLVDPDKRLRDLLDKRIIKVIAEYAGVQQWVTDVIDYVGKNPLWTVQTYDDARFELIMEEEGAITDVWNNEPLDVDLFMKGKKYLEYELRHKNDLEEEVKEKQENVEGLDLILRDEWVTDPDEKEKLESEVERVKENLARSKEQLEHIQAYETWQERITEEAIEERADLQAKNFAQAYRDLLQYSQGLDPAIIADQRSKLNSEVFNKAKYGIRQQSIGILLEITSEVLENGKINFAKLENLIRRNLFADQKTDENEIKAAILIIVQNVANGTGDVSVYQKRLLDEVPLSSTDADPDIDTSLSRGIIIRPVSKVANRSPFNWLKNREIRSEIKQTDMAQALTALDEYKEVNASFQDSMDWYLWIGIREEENLKVTNIDDIEYVFTQYQKRLDMIDYIGKNKSLLPVGEIKLDEWKEQVKDALYLVIYLLAIQQIKGKDNRVLLNDLMGSYDIRSKRNREEKDIDPKDPMLVVSLMRQLPARFKEELVQNIPFFKNSITLLLRKRLADIGAFADEYSDIYSQAIVELNSRRTALNDMVNTGLLGESRRREIANELDRTLNRIEGQVNTINRPHDITIDGMVENSTLIDEWLPFKDEFILPNTTFKERLEDLVLIRRRYLSNKQRLLEMAEDIQNNHQAAIEGFPNVLKTLTQLKNKYSSQKSPDFEISDQELINQIRFFNKQKLNVRESALIAMYIITSELRGKKVTEEDLANRVNVFFFGRIMKGLDFSQEKDKRTALLRTYSVIDKLWDVIMNDQSAVSEGLAELLNTVGITPNVEPRKFDADVRQILSTNNVHILPTNPTTPMDTPAMPFAATPTQPVPTVEPIQDVTAVQAAAATTGTNATESPDLSMFMRPTTATSEPPADSTPLPALTPQEVAPKDRPDIDLSLPESFLEQAAAPDAAAARLVLERQKFSEQAIQQVIAFITGMGYKVDDFNWDAMRQEGTGFIVDAFSEATEVAIAGLRISMDASNNVEMTPISKEAAAVTTPVEVTQPLPTVTSPDAAQPLPFDPVQSPPQVGENKAVGTTPTVIPVVPGAAPVFPPSAVDSSAVTPLSTPVVSADATPQPATNYNSDDTLTNIPIPKQAPIEPNPLETQVSMPTVNTPVVPATPEPQKPDDQPPVTPPEPTPPPVEPPAPPSGGTPTATDIDPVVVENGVDTPVVPLTPLGGLPPLPPATPPDAPPGPNIPGAPEVPVQSNIELTIDSIAEWEDDLRNIGIAGEILSNLLRKGHINRGNIILGRLTAESGYNVVINDQILPFQTITLSENGQINIRLSDKRVSLTFGAVEFPDVEFITLSKGELTAVEPRLRYLDLYSDPRIVMIPFEDMMFESDDNGESISSSKVTLILPDKPQSLMMIKNYVRLNPINFKEVRIFKDKTVSIGLSGQMSANFEDVWGGRYDELVLRDGVILAVNKDSNLSKQIYPEQVPIPSSGEEQVVNATDEAELEPVASELAVDSSSAVAEVSTPVENIQDDVEKKEEPNFEKAGEILIKLMSNINVTLSSDDVSKLVAEGKVTFHENYDDYTFDLSTVETNPEWNGIRIPRLEEVTVALDFGTGTARLAYAEGKEMSNTLINVSGVRSINVYSTSIQASGTFSTPLSYKVLAKVFPSFPADFENVDFQSDGEVVVSSILDKEKIFITNDGKEYEYNEARISKDKVILRRIPSGGVEPLTIDLSTPAVEVSPISTSATETSGETASGDVSEIVNLEESSQEAAVDWVKVYSGGNDDLGRILSQYDSSKIVDATGITTYNLPQGSRETINIGGFAYNNINRIDVSPTGEIKLSFEVPWEHNLQGLRIRSIGAVGVTPPKMEITTLHEEKSTRAFRRAMLIDSLMAQILFEKANVVEGGLQLGSGRIPFNWNKFRMPQTISFVSGTYDKEKGEVRLELERPVIYKGDRYTNVVITKGEVSLSYRGNDRVEHRISAFDTESEQTRLDQINLEALPVAERIVEVFTRFMREDWREFQQLYVNEANMIRSIITDLITTGVDIHHTTSINAAYLAMTRLLKGSPNLAAIEERYSIFREMQDNIVQFNGLHAEQVSKVTTETEVISSPDVREEVGQYTQEILNSLNKFEGHYSDEDDDNELPFLNYMGKFELGNIAFGLSNPNSSYFDTNLKKLADFVDDISYDEGKKYFHSFDSQNKALIPNDSQLELSGTFGVREVSSAIHEYIASWKMLQQTLSLLQDEIKDEDLKGDLESTVALIGSYVRNLELEIEVYDVKVGFRKPSPGSGQIVEADFKEII